MKDRASIRRRTGTLLAALALSASCSSPSFTSDLKLDSADDKSTLADRVHSIRDGLVEDQARFSSTVALFGQMVRFQTENPDATYEELQSEVDRCAERAGTLTERVEKLRSSGSEFFTAWDAELAQYNSPSMRGHSERMLSEALRGQEDLLGALGETTAQMNVVLLGMRDYLLFFNHNRTTHAVEVLAEENARFEAEVTGLEAYVNLSQDAADVFLEVLEGQAALSVETD